MTNEEELFFLLIFVVTICTSIGLILKFKSELKFKLVLFVLFFNFICSYTLLFCNTPTNEYNFFDRFIQSILGALFIFPAVFIITVPTFFLSYYAIFLIKKMFSSRCER